MYGITKHEINFVLITIDDQSDLKSYLKARLES